LWKTQASVALIKITTIQNSYLIFHLQLERMRLETMVSFIMGDAADFISHYVEDGLTYKFRTVV